MSVRNYIENSSRRAASLPSFNRGLIGEDYKQLVESGRTNRFRNNKVPRNLTYNVPAYNGYDTFKITLPMGTILFRATGIATRANTNVQKTRFHYFHPFPGMAVVGLSEGYSRFCMFALKYDTNFFLLIEPGPDTKRWVTQRNGGGNPSPFSSVDDNIFPKWICRSEGVQGWIGISGQDARKHAEVADKYPQYVGPKQEYMSNAHKFVHFDSWTRTQGFAGFPECVMWYQDLEHPGLNNLVIEPIVCLHMPTNASEAERMAYLHGFYKKVNEEHLIQLHTTAKVTGGGTIPFAYYTFPQMSTKELARQYLATPRSNLR